MKSKFKTNEEVENANIYTLADELVKENIYTVDKIDELLNKSREITIRCKYVEYFNIEN